ncbi:MAG: glycosyltransferase family 2 protein [Candidatus Hydrothermales bacterium]
MSINREKIFVVIPVYNEKESLYKVISETKDILPESKIIVVDDGSDPPVRLIKNPKLILLRHENNMGYGASLMSGIEFSISDGAEIIITIDADGQHFPKRIPDFLDKIKNNDFVSGSRYHPLSLKLSEPPSDRRIINIIITEILKELTGFNITDSFCGFKCFKSYFFENFISEEKGYGFPLELWYYAYKFKFKFEEVPCELYYPIKKEFPGNLRDQEKRLEYYLKILEKKFKAKLVEKGFKMLKNYLRKDQHE